MISNTGAELLHANSGCFSSSGAYEGGDEGVGGGAGGEDGEISTSYKLLVPSVVGLF